MTKAKSSLSSRLTDVVIVLIPFLLIPWTDREGPVDSLFRLLGDGENTGHGAIAAAILLVEIKYVFQALLYRSHAHGNSRLSEPSNQGSAPSHRRNLLGRKSFFDTVMVIFVGLLVGALGGFGGALIGGLAAFLILLHAPR